MPTQEYADQKAAKLNARADRLEALAREIESRNDCYRGDIAFNTQPGHIPARARAIARTERAAAMMQQAARLRERASYVSNHVAGTAEAKRTEKREAALEWLTVGAKVFEPLWGHGTILKINKKTALMDTDRGPQKVGIHWLKPTSG